MELCLSRFAADDVFCKPGDIWVHGLIRPLEGIAERARIFTAVCLGL
jgi:hypothetical protein